MRILQNLLLYNLLDPLLPKHFRQRRFVMLHIFLSELERKLGSQESLDHFTHQHTPHWEYLKDVVSWRTRLQLSCFRGKKWALTWRIKLIALFSGLGPQVAQWLLEEYMITAKVEDLPAPARSWVCAHCGTANDDTALFCKDCGEYK